MTPARFPLALAALLLLGPRTAPAQGPPILFDASWVGFEAGFHPSPFGPGSMALGDLDGDGDLDVFAGHDFRDGPGLSVLLNFGDGTFARPAYYSLPPEMSTGDVGLGDLDGDGDLDFFATVPDWRGLSTTLSVWRNDGLGRLTTQDDYTVGEGPVGLVVADLDGDGRIDAATADHGYNGRGSTVSLLWHNGLSGAAAGFFPARTVAVGASPFDLAAGDVSGDGITDLVVGRGGGLSGDGVLTVLVSAGAGRFPPPFVEYPAGSIYYPVLGLADLDRDGDLDLASAFNGASGAVVTLRRNDGAGGFGGAEEYPLDPWCPYVAQFAFADLDGDGWLDVATANPDGRSFEGLRVLRGDRRGGLLPLERYEAAQNTQSLTAADLDRDGDLDLLSLAHSSATLALHRNPGTGVFPRTPRFSTASFPGGMDAADLDGDGDLDVAVGDNARVYIHRNDGLGALAPATSFRPALSPRPLYLRDLDGDGLADLLIPGQGFLVARNLGNATFSAGTVSPIGACVDSLTTLDFDGDGDLDIAVSDCAFPYELRIARNNGGLVFEEVWSTPLTVSANRLEAGDLDGDGKLDLVASQGGYGVAGLLGAGDGTFSAPVLSLDATPPYLMKLADLNGDGRADLAMQVPADAFGTDKIGIAPGLGDGRFGSPPLYRGSMALEILAIGVDLDLADANCDGKLDLLVTSYAANDVGVFLSNGNGTLEPEVRYGAGTTPQITVAGDFTGDGVIDLATVVHAGGSTCCEEAIAILRGLCGCAGPDTVPADLGNVLMAVKRGGADVELSWSAAAPSRYRLFRDGLKTMLGRTAAPPDLAAAPFTDAGGIARTGLDYWRLKALSACTYTAGP